MGIDIKEVIQGCSTKYNFQPHFPGPGVGGPCLPANPYYIIQDAEKVDYIPFLIRVSREVNDRMPQYVAKLVTNALNFIGKSVKNSTITILGISYKANVRDIQISPAIKVIQFLQSLQAKIKVWDPYYKGEFVENFMVSHSLNEAVENSDCILLLTDHEEFKTIDFSELSEILDRELLLVDSRNIYSEDQLPEGTIYCGVGRMLKIIEKP